MLKHSCMLILNRVKDRKPSCPWSVEICRDKRISITLPEALKPPIFPHPFIYGGGQRSHLALHRMYSGRRHPLATLGLRLIAALHPECELLNNSNHLMLNW